MEKRIFVSMIMCLSLLLMPCTIHAASTVDAVEPICVSTECSLNMTYSYDKSTFPGITAKIYKIANVSEDFQYTLTSDFSDCGLSLNGIQSVSEWNIIRSTLETYIETYRPESYETAVTDNNGQVHFEKLQTGMYLIMPVRVTQNGFRYYFASALFSLPNLDADGTWNYEVAARPKTEATEPSGSDKQYKVLKLWKDEDNESRRPESVEVDILRDGQTVKTVTLSDQNNWSYSWIAEDDDSVWKVTERNVPYGYVMTVEERTATFVIINSLTQEHEQPEEPESPEEPGMPDNPVVPITGDTMNFGLYVMLICVSGILLVLLGVAGKRRDE